MSRDNNITLVGVSVDDFLQDVADLHGLFGDLLEAVADDLLGGLPLLEAGVLSVTGDDTGHEAGGDMASVDCDQVAGDQCQCCDQCYHSVTMSPRSHH